MGRPVIASRLRLSDNAFGPLNTKEIYGLNLNLFMGAFWLLLGGALVVYTWVDPIGAPRVWDTNISIGWVGIVLALYNFARWWSSRSYLKQQREILEATRRREHENAHPRKEEVHDPTFDFTSEE